MSVTVKKSDNTTAVLNVGDVQVSTVDFTTVGTKTITISYEGKTTTFDITVKAHPISIVSKSIQSLDFSTKPSTTAMLVGKELPTDQFSQTPKKFTLEVETAEETKTLPIDLYWNLSTEFPWGDGISGVINSYAQMKFGVYDYPLVSWKNSANEKAFNVVALVSGSAVKLKATGPDASYFFEELTVQGTDEDTSKNRSFVVSDGTNSVTLNLATKFSTMDALVNWMNTRLRNANVQASFSKVDDQHFKITSTADGLIISGVNKEDFFE